MNQLSLTVKLAIAAGFVVLIVAAWLGIRGWLISERIAKLQEAAVELRQQNQQITDQYFEAIGERNALRAQAQQLALEANAYRQAGEKRGANVQALDQKIQAIRTQNDEIQISVGDCSSVAQCRKQLCQKYAAAGIILKSCAN